MCWLALLCGICTFICYALYALQWDTLIRYELAIKDLMLSSDRGVIGPNTNLVFVGIDQPTYTDVLSPEEIEADPVLAQTTNTFPWPRNVWAPAIDRLGEAGAKVILLDIVFATPGPGDDALRSALQRHQDRVVIGANFLGEKNKSVGKMETLMLPTDSVLGPVQKPATDPRVGFVNVYAERDDVVRRAVFRVTGENGLAPGESMLSLAARAVNKAGGGRFIPEDTEQHLFRFSAAPNVGYKPIPFYQILLPAYWTNNFNSGAFFKDKIVIIGPAANILHDEHRTPFPGPAMAGPEIHLNIIAAALRGAFLGETSDILNRASVIFTGLTALLFALLIKSPLRRLLLALAILALYALACWLVFLKLDFCLLVIAPMACLGTSSLATFAYDFVLVRNEKNRTRRTLERYVSKDVVRELLDNPDTYLNVLGGKRRPVTILFSDLRGFTTMTESADESQLVAQLNEYFNEMVAIVFHEHGSLDKFIGDCVMALWGSITTLGPERDAQHAVAAALAMRRALHKLNISWSQRGMRELSFGIGLNHGTPIVGNLGSEQKMEVSVIGDAVNLASRLEGLTKEYKLDLLLGESMVPLVQSRFVLRRVDSVRVLGKTKPVHVFTVMADKEAGEQPPPWLALYEEAVRLYRSRQFVEANALFAECVQAAPEDYLSQLYVHRCQELIANPPSASWDTTFVMKSK
jgi:adenylate cyclase